MKEVKKILKNQKRRKKFVKCKKNNKHMRNINKGKNWKKLPEELKWD